MSQDVDFDIWYGALRMELSEKGYLDPPDTAVARGDYDNHMTPDRSAELFIKEWNVTQND